MSGKGRERSCKAMVEFNFLLDYNNKALRIVLEWYRIYYTYRYQYNPQQTNNNHVLLVPVYNVQRSGTGTSTNSYIIKHNRKRNHSPEIVIVSRFCADFDIKCYLEASKLKLVSWWIEKSRFHS